MGLHFRYDVILEAEDLCNRQEEEKRILSIMQKQGRLVIYSLRRMGKSSLLNVCQKEFQKQVPQSFVLWIDLNEVTNTEDVAHRFRIHYELALQNTFPIQRAKSYLNKLLGKINLDLPGGIQVSLDEFTKENPQKYLLNLFQGLKTLSEEQHMIIVIDEFQGIADLEEVQAILRSELKKLNKAAIILMGSNQRLLYKMFNDKKAPFFGFGQDLELKSIAVKDYAPYMNERFRHFDLCLSDEVTEYLLNKMNQIPNYINELCAWICDAYSGLEITKDLVDEALLKCAQSKRGRYQSALYGYTTNQKRFIKAIAKLGPVKAHTGKDMQKWTALTSSELTNVATVLEDSPLIARDTQNNWFIPDPFLQHFLILS